MLVREKLAPARPVRTTALATHEAYRLIAILGESFPNPWATLPTFVDHAKLVGDRVLALRFVSGSLRLGVSAAGEFAVSSARPPRARASPGSP